MTKPLKLLFDVSFPNITLWVQGCGTVEIGNNSSTDSFVRALDKGGMVWSGKRRYKTLDEALHDMESALGRVLVRIAVGGMSASRRKDTPKPPKAKKPKVSRRKGPPEDPGIKQIGKLDAIVEAIRGKENVQVTRLTVVKKLCENAETAQAFALFLARKAQERLREKKGNERYRPLANRAVTEMKAYQDKPTEDRRWQLLELLRIIQEEQNEYKSMGWSLVRTIKNWDLLIVEQALRGFIRTHEAKYWLYQATRDYVGSSDFLTAKHIPMIEDIARFWRRYFKVKA